MAELQYLEFTEAMGNWSRCFEEMSIPHFNQFICFDLRGLSYNPTNDTFDVSEEVIRRVHMLTGPHYKTIIRAWCIQQGISTSVKATWRHVTDLLD